MDTIVTRIKILWVYTLDIFFPRTCIGCGKERTALCRACVEALPKPATNIPAWIHALYSYKHSIAKESIWRLKYTHTHDIARVYGGYMYDAIIVDVSERGAFETHTVYLVPIPLPRSRMRERGYNQAALIAHAIREHDTEKLLCDGSHFLKRKDMPVRQSHTKHKSERLKNIIGSFYTSHPLPKNAHCILIDDVVTTGATLIEAKRILTQSGARKVSAYTIAH